MRRPIIAAYCMCPRVRDGQLSGVCPGFCYTFSMETLPIVRAMVPPSLRRLDARPTPRRKWIAIAVAAVADLVQLGFAPAFVEGALSPFDLVLDVATAIALLGILGWRWRTAIALALELVPGLALFPSWTLVVATLRTAEPAQP